MLAQRDVISSSLRSMTSLYRQLGQSLSAHFKHNPLDLDLEQSIVVGLPGEDERANIDSQIEGLRSSGAVDVTAFQSLLMIVESEVFPSNRDGGVEAGGETCADSLITSRFPSIRSEAIDNDSDSEMIVPAIDISRFAGRGVVEGNTQAQGSEPSPPVHFATQQCDEVDNNATGMSVG